MTQQSEWQLPDGLPARFVGNDGFGRLCEFLGIVNRQHKQKAVSLIKFHHPKLNVALPKTLTTAQRLQRLLTRFYKSATYRRLHWRTSATDPNPIDPNLLPCLEVRSLSSFDMEFKKRQIDDASLDKALVGFSGLVSSTDNLPEWKRPPLALWPALRNKVNDWDALNEESRDSVTLALFAVATILDDVRVLRWAAESARPLATEFAFAVEGDQKTIQRGPAASCRTADPLMRRWREECRVVAELASTLEGSARRFPDLRVYGDFQSHVKRLEDLHDRVKSIIDRSHLEEQVHLLIKAVNRLGDEFQARWLRTAAQIIGTQWRQTYLAADSVDTDEFSKDSERALRDSRIEITKWRSAVDDQQTFKAEFERMNETDDDNIEAHFVHNDRELELYESLAKVTKRVRRLERNTLNAAVPTGKSFDPSARPPDESGSGKQTGIPQPQTPDPSSGPSKPTEYRKVPAVAHTGTPTEARGMPKPDPRLRPQKVDPSARPPDESGSGKQTGIPQPQTPDPSSGPSKPTEHSEVAAVADKGMPTEARGMPKPDPRHRHQKEPLDKAEEEHSESSASASTAATPTTPTVGSADHDVPADDRRPRRSASNTHDTELQVLWKSLLHRPGISFHIARLLSENGLDHPELPPPHLVAATVLAKFTQASDEDAASALRSHIMQIDPADLSRDDPELQDSLNLLLFCATARPALVAPATGATALLRATRPLSPLSAVYELAKTVADHGETLGHNVRFDATLITTVLNQEGWLQDIQTLRGRAHDWLSKAAKQRIIFTPAHRVWMLLLRESECLGKLARLVAEAEPAQRNMVEHLRQRANDEQSFADLVRTADRDIRGRTRYGIEGKALRQLRRHAKPLLDLSANWLRLVEARSDSTDFVQRKIVSLCQDVRSLGGSAAEEIERLARSTTSIPLGVSLALAKQTIESLQQLFEPGVTTTTPFVTNQDTLLSHDLLFVPRLVLDPQYNPDDRRPDVLAMLANVSDHASTMSGAFDTRLNRGDLVGAGLACFQMEWCEDPDSHRARVALEYAIRRKRVELNKQCNAYREALEQSLRFGQLDQNTADNLRSSLVSVEYDIEAAGVSLDAASIDRAQGSIEQVIQSIEAHRSMGQSSAQKRFESISNTCDPNARTRIERSISDGDLMSANELMSRVEAGQPLNQQTHEVQSDPFRDFIAAVDEIDKFAADPSNSPQSIVDAVSRGHGFANDESKKMSSVEIEDAKQLLEAWYELSLAKQFESMPLGKLLQGLGLPHHRLMEKEKGPDYSVVTLETDTIEDRYRCPLPQFGSEARGQYRILLNWTRIARESIVRHIDNRRHDATIVLHFGSLGSDRSWLRRWAVAQHRLFVVVDESLVLFLARRPSGRLSALFRCVLPFSDAEPYVTTSGLVPPELFFGRRRERRGIMDRNGPCFIYGGRQLGKTALLRSVEREFHQPDRQRFAKWIDLKVREIGHPRRAAEIWPLLWHELRELGVIEGLDNEPNPHIPRHVDKLINNIEQWSAHDDQRHLLLLLDEADYFLLDDADDDFRESTRLKGMMEQTGRRVKVVFAGLHNVLRITERANHPLAHLGEPINIGPLLTNGEWIEAQNLVNIPLESVGFHFEPQDLSTRILAQTNYYPSLIQLYGAELVRYLRESVTIVPYGITDEDIGRVFRRGTLRSAIRERFQLTLQLDPRYEVVAYALAFDLLGKDSDLGYGIDRRQLAVDARGWWPDGFDDDDREFNVLLQEMEGLGVLRSIDDSGRYTLRNPNVLLLLGSRDEIYRVLEKPREKPQRFEKASFHARYSDRDSTLCPLTYEQESTLRKGGGVAVVTGCNASGIEDVKRFLSRRIEHTCFHELSNALVAENFRRMLGQFRPKSRNLTTVVLVSHLEQWNIDWILAARDALRVKKTGDRIKVLFVANPRLLWRLMKQMTDKPIEQPEWIGIRPWNQIFLRHWLSENNQPHDSAHVQELMEVSGGWPSVLAKFVRLRPKSKTWEGRMEALHNTLRRTNTWLKTFSLTSAAKKELGAVWNHLPIRSDSDGDLNVVAEMEEIDAAVLRMRVQWSKHLGLLSSSEGSWKFNPLLAKLIAASVKK